MAEMKMVIGLGNPGRRYVNTRHNVGFRVIDLLAETLKIKVNKKKFGAHLGTGEFAGVKLILLKPWQFMNRSGQSVATAVDFYKLSTDDLLLITDDMALETGRIRIRAKGSSGGHKGLADIIEKLGTENIGRLRIGIGQSDRESAEEYVLDKPTEPEKLLLTKGIKRAQEAVVCWIKYGIQTAMNIFNSRIEQQN